MADRKAPSQPGKNTAGGKANGPSTVKSGANRPGAKPSATKAAGKSGAGPAAKKVAGRPGKRPKSIVNQRQTPWGMIITVAVVVVFAVGIIVFAVTRGGSSNSNPYTVPELADAKSITGIQYKAEPNHNHIASGTVNYDTTPPTGGDHSPYWADCTGTVYPNAIANENATHMLEHGAVWITYKPGLPAAQVATLSALVKGKDRMAMSPYPGLKSNISLQSWGYQLFVDNSNDPRIQQFINLLRYNQKTTPEPSATCSQPTFITNPSTFGHPLFAPAGS